MASFQINTQNTTHCQDSAVSTQTCQTVLGSKLSCSKIFLYPSRPAPKPTWPPVQWVPALNTHSNAVWVWLTTHPQLVQRLKKQYSYASPLTPLPSSDFMACYRENFTLKTSQMFHPSEQGTKCTNDVVSLKCGNNQFTFYSKVRSALSYHILPVCQ